MRDAAPSHVPRWARLRPADAVDGALLALASLGVLLAAAALVFRDVLGFGGGPMGVVVVILTRLHGSTPAFAFLAAAFYLTRRGRTIGPPRRWVWGGLVVTLPLWLLLGLPISVRGLGDITPFVLLLNLLGALMMVVGVRATLGARAPP